MVLKPTITYYFDKTISTPLGFYYYENINYEEITHPYDFRYPYKPWPFFKKWEYQNYSGNWISGADCKIKHVFTNSDFEDCFSKGSKRIILVEQGFKRDYCLINRR